MLNLKGSGFIQDSYLAINGQAIDTTNMAAGEVQGSIAVTAAQSVEIQVVFDKTQLIHIHSQLSYRKGSIIWAKRP
jgi:hypothetical protein